METFRLLVRRLANAFDDWFQARAHLLWFLVALVLLYVFAWEKGADRIREATAVVAIELLRAVTLRFCLGILAALVALSAWSRAQHAIRGVDRIGITRHWGGLGAGEGGWEIDARAAQWLVNLVAALALSVVAFVLLVPPVIAGDAGAKAPDERTKDVTATDTRGAAGGQAGTRPNTAGNSGAAGH